MLTRRCEWCDFEQVIKEGESVDVGWELSVDFKCPSCAAAWDEGAADIGIKVEEYEESLVDAFKAEYLKDKTRNPFSSP